MNCIFCKIVNKEIKTKVLYEDEDVMAFDDINPIAPVHVLVIPKRHIVSITEAKDSDTLVMGKLIMVAKKVAEEKNISKNGYKLLIRVGKNGGQEIFHAHLHLIGGARLSENIHPV